MDLAKFIELSNDCNDTWQLYKLLEDALIYSCGYDRVIFSLMSDHDSLGLHAGHGIMRNYPDSWMKHYVESGYEHLDPVRRFGFRHVGPFLWDALPLVMDLTPKQQLCMNQSREAGLYNGAALCLRGIVGEVAGVGVASSAKQPKLSEKDMKFQLATLNAISQQFYVIFCALHERKNDLSSKQIILTEKELEVFRFLAVAKSDGEISDILSISPHTVDYHVRNILRKFGVSNRVMAVMKGIHCGIIGPHETAFVRGSGN